MYAHEYHCSPKNMWQAKLRIARPTCVKTKLKISLECWLDLGLFSVPQGCKTFTKAPIPRCLNFVYFVCKTVSIEVV